MIGIQCKIKDVKLTRANGFKLKIDHLELSTNGADTSVTKLPITGRSGSGKSTFLNIMAGIEKPDKCDIEWQFSETDRIRWNEKGIINGSINTMNQLWQKYFGFVFQDSTLTEHFTVGENLKYPLLLSGKLPDQAENIAREWLKAFFLDSLYNRYPNTLSGGEKQRVALLQAMIHEPHVLFADEPTGNLDIDTRTEVMKVLDDWIKERSDGSRLLIWVTHHEKYSKRGTDDILKKVKIDNGAPELMDYKEDNHVC